MWDVAGGNNKIDPVTFQYDNKMHLIKETSSISKHREWKSERERDGIMG